MQKQYGKEEGKRFILQLLQTADARDVPDQTFNDGKLTTAAIDQNKKLLGKKMKKNQQLPNKQPLVQLDMKEENILEKRRIGNMEKKLFKRQNPQNEIKRLNQLT